MNQVLCVLVLLLPIEIGMYINLYHLLRNVNPDRKPVRCFNLRFFPDFFPPEKERKITKPILRSDPIRSETDSSLEV